MSLSGEWAAPMRASSPNNDNVGTGEDGCLPSQSQQQQQQQHHQQPRQQQQQQQQQQRQTASPSKQRSANRRVLPPPPNLSMRQQSAVSKEARMEMLVRRFSLPLLERNTNSELHLEGCIMEDGRGLASTTPPRPLPTMPATTTKTTTTTSSTPEKRTLPVRRSRSSFVNSLSDVTMTSPFPLTASAEEDDDDVLLQQTRTPDAAAGKNPAALRRRAQDASYAAAVAAVALTAEEEEEEEEEEEGASIKHSPAHVLPTSIAASLSRPVAAPLSIEEQVLVVEPDSDPARVDLQPQQQPGIAVAASPNARPLPAAPPHRRVHRPLNMNRPTASSAPSTDSSSAHLSTTPSDRPGNSPSKLMVVAEAPNNQQLHLHLNTNLSHTSSALAPSESDSLSATSAARLEPEQTSLEETGASSSAGSRRTSPERIACVSLAASATSPAASSVDVLTSTGTANGVVKGQDVLQKTQSITVPPHDLGKTYCLSPKKELFCPSSTSCNNSTACQTSAPTTSATICSWPFPEDGRSTEVYFTSNTTQPPKPNASSTAVPSSSSSSLPTTTTTSSSSSSLSSTVTLQSPTKLKSTAVAVHVSPTPRTNPPSAPGSGTIESYHLAPQSHDQKPPECKPLVLLRPKCPSASSILLQRPQSAPEGSGVDRWMRYGCESLRFFDENKPERTDAGVAARTVHTHFQEEGEGWLSGKDIQGRNNNKSSSNRSSVNSDGQCDSRLMKHSTTALSDDTFATSCVASGSPSESSAPRRFQLLTPSSLSNRASAPAELAPAPSATAATPSVVALAPQYLLHLRASPSQNTRPQSAPQADWQTTSSRQYAHSSDSSSSPGSSPPSYLLTPASSSSSSPAGRRRKVWGVPTRIEPTFLPEGRRGTEDFGSSS